MLESHTAQGTKLCSAGRRNRPTTGPSQKTAETAKQRCDYSRELQWVYTSVPKKSIKEIQFEKLCLQGGLDKGRKKFSLKQTDLQCIANMEME